MPFHNEDFCHLHTVKRKWKHQNRVTLITTWTNCIWTPNAMRIYSTIYTFKLHVYLLLFYNCVWDSADK